MGTTQVPDKNGDPPPLGLGFALAVLGTFYVRGALLGFVILSVLTGVSFFTVYPLAHGAGLPPTVGSPTWLPSGAVPGPSST